MLHLKNLHLVLIVYSVSVIKVLSQRLSFTVNDLFRVSNIYFVLHHKSYHSVLMVYSGSQINALSHELSFSYNGL